MDIYIEREREREREREIERENSKGLQIILFVEMFDDVSELELQHANLTQNTTKGNRMF